MKILFSDKNSQRGAKMFVAKHKRMKVESITSAGPRIVTRKYLINYLFSMRPCCMYKYPSPIILVGAEIPYMSYIIILSK